MKNEKEFTGYGYNENCIEWVKDSNKATLSLSQRSLISKIEKLGKSHPEECKITARNTDGSICVHMPRSWIKIRPTKQLSDEEKNKITERLVRK
jgi:hypothetical protein